MEKDKKDKTGEYETFYRPVITDEPILSHCAGSHDPSYQVGSTTRCFIKKSQELEVGDLRYQLNVLRHSLPSGVTMRCMVRNSWFVAPLQLLPSGFTQ